MFIIDACRIRSGGGVVHALQIIESAVKLEIPFIAYVSAEVYSSASDIAINSGCLRCAPSGYKSLFWQFFFLPFIVGFNKRLITLDSASVCPISSYIAIHQDLYAFEYDLYKNRLTYKVKFVSLFNRFTLSRAQKCVFQTKHAYNIVSNSTSISSYAIIPHGANPFFDNLSFNKIKPINISNEKSLPIKKLLSVGPLFPYKDYLYVLEVLALLRDDGFNFTYTIVGGVGDNSYYEEVKRKIHQLNLNCHVELVGKCDLTEVKGYYLDSDILIFSSLCETFGITILESLQFRLPIVANDTPSNREILTVGGEFYNNNDFNSLKLFLENIFISENFSLLAIAQHENLSRFSWENITKDFWIYVNNI